MYLVHKGFLDVLVFLELDLVTKGSPPPPPDDRTLSLCDSHGRVPHCELTSLLCNIDLCSHCLDVRSHYAVWRGPTFSLHRKHHVASRPDSGTGHQHSPHRLTFYFQFISSLATAEGTGASLASANSQRQQYAQAYPYNDREMKVNNKQHHQMVDVIQWTLLVYLG